MPPTSSRAMQWDWLAGWRRAYFHEPVCGWKGQAAKGWKRIHAALARVDDDGRRV